MHVLQIMSFDSVHIYIFTCYVIILSDIPLFFSFRYEKSFEEILVYEDVDANDAKTLET